MGFVATNAGSSSGGWLDSIGPLVGTVGNVIGGLIGKKKTPPPPPPPPFPIVPVMVFTGVALLGVVLLTQGNRGRRR